MEITSVGHIGAVGTSQYPWEDWLNGRCWLVRTQADFLCLSTSLRGQAHTWARKLGVDVTTRGIEDIGVLIQAYPVGSTWRPNLAAITWSQIKKSIANPR